MSIKSKLNHYDIAKEIYEYMRYEYKFLTHKGMKIDKCITTLSSKLKRLNDFEVLLWGDALDVIAQVKSDNAPTPVEIIHAIKDKAKTFRMVVDDNKPRREAVNDDIDYAALWKAADDKERFRFFMDYKFNDVQPYVRYWFIKYNEEHRDWSRHESQMMMGYWKLPFANAHEGAMINHQRDIIKYFEERNAN